jgi:coproporphyrinogen III oxidase
MFNHCPFVGYTYTEDAIACTENEGEVKGSDGWIGFGGDMEPEYLTGEHRLECIKIWKEICRRKVNEAYEEYMA